MKNRLAIGLVLAALLAVVGGTEAAAQDRSGTAGSQYLVVPNTAQTASLGMSITGGLETLNGIEALYMNPAGLMLNTGTSALVSRMNYVADIGVNTFGVAHRIGNNNLALTIGAWDFGDIPVQTEDSPEITEVTYSATSITAGLSYARQFTDRIAAGVTFKLLNERISDMDATGIALDAGMTYIVGESGLRFGVSLTNFGQELAYDGTGLGRDVRIPGQPGNATTVTLDIEASDFELPSALNFGVSYARPLGASLELTALGNFASNAYGDDQFAGGLQLGFQDLLFFRGGYQFQSDMENTFYEGWNLGAGLSLGIAGSRLAVDYAYRATQYFSNVQLLTATFTL